MWRWFTRLEPERKCCPLVETEDHLQLIDGGGEDVLQLTSRDGVPARLELGDGYFLGPQIQT